MFMFIVVLLRGLCDLSLLYSAPARAQLAVVHVLGGCCGALGVLWIPWFGGVPRGLSHELIRVCTGSAQMN